MANKRKNEAPRRIQWGLLVVGFILGVLLTVFVMQRANVPVSQDVSTPDAAFWMTATQIIQDATATAAAVFEPTQNPALDTFMATATAIVAEATQTAQSGG